MMELYAGKAPEIDIQDILRNFGAKRESVF